MSALDPRRRPIDLVALRERLRGISATEARRIIEEVRAAALKVDGTMALGAHTMRSLRRLDRVRVTLSQDDPVSNALLSEIEAVAIEQAKAIQAGLFNVWGV